LYVRSITTISRLVDSRLWRTHVEAEVEAVVAVLAVDHGELVGVLGARGGGGGDEEREGQHEEERELHNDGYGVGLFRGVVDIK
jgi:hypothetical protein